MDKENLYTDSTGVLYATAPHPYAENRTARVYCFGCAFNHRVADCAQVLCHEATRRDHRKVVWRKSRKQPAPEKDPNPL